MEVGESGWGGIGNELDCGRSVPAYADGLVISRAVEAQLSCIEDSLKRFEAVERTTIKTEKSIESQFSTWRGKLILFSVVEHWLEGPVNLPGI